MRVKMVEDGSYRQSPRSLQTGNSRQIRMLLNGSNSQRWEHEEIEVRERVAGRRFDGCGFIYGKNKTTCH